MKKILILAAMLMLPACEINCWVDEGTGEIQCDEDAQEEAVTCDWDIFDGNNDCQSDDDSEVCLDEATGEVFNCEQ